MPSIPSLLQKELSERNNSLFTTDVSERKQKVPLFEHETVSSSSVNITDDADISSSELDTLKILAKILKRRSHKVNKVVNDGEEVSSVPSEDSKATNNRRLNIEKIVKKAELSFSKELEKILEIPEKPNTREKSTSPIKEFTPSTMQKKKKDSMIQANLTGKFSYSNPVAEKLDNINQGNGDTTTADWSQSQSVHCSCPSYNSFLVTKMPHLHPIPKFKRTKNAIIGSSHVSKDKPTSKSQKKKKTNYAAEKKENDARDQSLLFEEETSMIKSLADVCKDIENDLHGKNKYLSLISAPKMKAEVVIKEENFNELLSVIHSLNGL